MEKEEDIIKNLEAEGYDSVYIWSAEPNEEDPEHTHAFDTKLHILSGEIRLKVLKAGRIDDFKLKQGSAVEIMRGQKHSAVVGQGGCKYIVAEKH